VKTVSNWHGGGVRTTVVSWRRIADVGKRNRQGTFYIDPWPEHKTNNSNINKAQKNCFSRTQFSADTFNYDNNW